jgi:hypothetical protein
VTSFVGVPVADAGVPGDAGESVVEPVAGVGAAIGVAEDEVAVVPALSGGEPFGGLNLLVRLQGGDRALRNPEGAARAGCLGVTAGVPGLPSWRTTEVVVARAERR